MKHQVKKGPEGGRFQCSRGDKRYLLDGPIKHGPYGGRFQGRGEKKRYLLS